MYRWRADHPRPDTDALALGRAIHTAVLEPSIYEEEYTVKPREMKYSTKEGRAWRAERLDKTILTVDHGRTLGYVLESLARNDEAQDIISHGDTEQTIEWKNERLDCKARVDILGQTHITDLKTTRDLKWFERDAERLLYHGQLAWYLDGAIAAGLLDASVAGASVIVVETSEPYDTAVCRVPAYALEAGRNLYQGLLCYYRECKLNGSWPGRAPGIGTLDLSPRAAGMEEEGF
jgi:hypothetical protein